MWGLFFPPAASHPQSRIEFHHRLWRMGRGWSAVWRAAGHPVWHPGQRTPQILHCLRALNCPESWHKAIKGQPRADRIPEQMLATSQDYRAHLWGKERHPFYWPLEKLTVTFSTLSCFPLRPAQAYPVPRGHPDSRGALWVGSIKTTLGCRPSWLGVEGAVGGWFMPDAQGSMERQQSAT